MRYMITTGGQQSHCRLSLLEGSAPAHGAGGSRGGAQGPLLTPTLFLPIIKSAFLDQVYWYGFYAAVATDILRRMPPIFS